MSLFGGMKVKEDAPTPSPTTPEKKPAASGFSFVKKDGAKKDTGAPASTGGFSFIKKDSPAPASGSGGGGGGGFAFIKKDAGAGSTPEPKSAPSTAAQTPSAPSNSAVPSATSSQAEPMVSKKKKKKGRKVGYDRDAQLGTMAMPVTPPATTTPANEAPTTTTTTAATTTAPFAVATPASQTSRQPDSGAQRSAVITTASPSKPQQERAQQMAPISTNQRTSAAPQARQKQSVQRPRSSSNSKAKSSDGKSGAPAQGGIMKTFGSFFGRKGGKSQSSPTPAKKGVPQKGGQPSRGQPDQQRQKAGNPQAARGMPNNAQQGRDAKRWESRPGDHVNQQRPGALPIRPDGTAPSETIDTRVPHPAVQDTPQNPPLSNPAPPEAPDTAKEAPPPAATEEVSQTIPEKAPEAKEPEAPPKPATPEPEPVIVLKPGIDGAFETTISEQCMQTVEAAQQEIEASQQTMEAIDAEQTELLSQLSASRRAKVDGIRSIKVKSQELEDAIEKEQYDVAAMLETEVAELRSIVSDDDISADSEELRSRLNDLLVRKLALWEEEAAVHQETVDKLRDMTHLQEEEIKAFEFDLDAATADEKGDIDARRSKLAKTKNHLDVDQQHHDEEIARVNKLSDERSAAFKNEKQRLVSTQTEVQDRIAELKQELNRLELEDEELTKNIAVQDERIEHAESGLSADRKRMEEESQQLAETRGTLAADQQKLDLDNARLEDSTAELRAKREELDISLRQTREHVAFAIRAKHENIVLTTAVADFQEQYELVLDPFSVSGGGDENLVQLKTDLTEKTESVKTLTNSVLQMQSTASSLRKSLEDIATRVPELQQSKKVAVSGRNFKEAQRLQEEVKTLESEQVEQTVELKELNASLLTETEALDAAKEMEAKLSEDWKTKEVGFDTAAIKELRAKNDELREKILGLKSGSTEIAKLIRIDAEACELLEEQLSIKHGLEFVAPEQSLDDLVATALLGAHSQNLLLILDDPVAEDESADFAAEQASAEQDNVTPIMGDLASLDMGHDRTLPLEPTEAGEDDATAQDVEADDTTETAEVVASVDDATQAAATEDVTTTSTAGDDQTESDDGGNGGDGGDAAVEADVDSNADTNEDTNTEIDVDPEPTPVEPVANDDTAAEPEADEGDAVDIEGIKAQIATLEADMEIALAEEDYDACEHIHDNIEALKAQLPESDTSELKRAR